MSKLLNGRFTLNNLLSISFAIAVSTQNAYGLEPECPEITGKTIIGTASWYGGKFHGRRTANGEIFNKFAYTAAHKKMKMGTVVRVTNLENGESVNVRINDRGPYHGNRVLDLSKAAAQEIDILDTGTEKVRIEVCAPPESQRYSLR
ncbi:MAG: septal ring lytic transglycosylase RlpA family protein [Pseudobdellovibrionaceae bacterium]|nr:septal ring lytic transglycosylase RlpA family protein [Pseudobdellovibrionaceae bacterium]